MMLLEELEASIIASGKPTCLTCKYWKQDTDFGHPLCVGDCRRFPPAFIGRGIQAEFPEVSLEDWCGEYQPRDAQ